MKSLKPILTLRLAIVAILASCAYGGAATGNAAVSCPSVGSDGVTTFPDGTLGMRKPLNVNPDGTDFSYTKGNHGFTYIQNGVDLWRGGAVCDKTTTLCRISCKSHFKECGEKWQDAEDKGFVEGTAEFYSFAIEGEGIGGKSPKQVKDAYILGNGLGRPKIAGSTKTITGDSIEYYRSMTSVKHTVAGKVVYLDSAIVAALVAPGSASNYLGNVVWLTNGDPDSSVFAVVGDTGGKWGESSVALHQLLRYGRLIPQLPGPIPIKDRCSDAETGLKAPFESKPDTPSDICKAGRPPTSPADIRAYFNYEKPVLALVLGKARMPIQGLTISTEVTPQALANTAETAGYSTSTLRALAACVKN